MRMIYAFMIFFASGLLTHAQDVPRSIEPYSLPDKARQALVALAAQSDVLILGETHGTQEVPAVGAALLAPLSELGYGLLALEVPATERGPLTDWATGKTDVVPGFFAKPFPDGRGNIQVLSLIRTALSAPHGWQLICFDHSDDGAGELPPMTDDPFALSAWRDAAMAANLARQRAQLAPNAKVLAICGNLHARTSKTCTPADPAADMMAKLWPSFAGALANNHPMWHVRSINVVPHSGGFYAMISVEGEDEPTGGKVHPFRSKLQLSEAEAHALQDQYWNWELNLPRATPATFLATPSMGQPQPKSR